MNDAVKPIFTDEWQTIRQIHERTRYSKRIIKRARILAMAAGLVAKRLVGKGEVPEYRRLCR